MSMKTSFLLAIGAAWAALALLQDVGATSTDVVLNLEGNPTCSSLGPNKDIVEVRDNDPPNKGGQTTVFGPDGQEVTYKVADDGKGIAQWSSTVSVNYVILKGRHGARVFHFGSGGISSDTDEESRGYLRAVSFCYGLGDGNGGGTPSLSELPKCDDLDGTDIMCPMDSSEKRVIISLDPNAPNFGLNDFKFCTCGDDKFKICDPNADTNDPDRQPCPNGGALERVPIDILGVEDPDSFFCYSIGGIRQCFYHASF
jgi:hypothetical protein